MWQILPSSKEKMEPIDIQKMALLMRQDDSFNIVIWDGVKEHDTGFEDLSVSRRKQFRAAHAELVLTGDKLFVRDLGSTSGTFINDRKIPKHRVNRPSEQIELSPGDRVRCGALSEFMIMRDNRLVIRSGESVVIPREVAAEIIKRGEEDDILCANEAKTDEEASYVIGMREGTINIGGRLIDVVPQASHNWGGLNGEIRRTINIYEKEKCSDGFYKMLGNLTSEPWRLMILEYSSDCYNIMVKVHRDYVVHYCIMEAVVEQMRDELNRLQDWIDRRRGGV